MNDCTVSIKLFLNVSRDFNLENPIAVTQKLFNYCCKNQWAGYDPYDALNSQILNFIPNLNLRIPRIILTQFLKRCPVNLRPLLLIPKTQNPKALALFLKSFVKLSKLGLLSQEELIAKMIDSLIAHRSVDSEYWCWGYSFPWQTRTILVPSGAPNLVCTVFVANALLDAYELNRDTRCLDMAYSAAEYILNDLFWTNGAAAGFSYPQPLSRTPVYNANFLAAALLCRVYNLSGEHRFVNAAIQVTRYSAAKQQADGSWHYGEASNQHWADNFHTGFNLCALHEISRYIVTSEFDAKISLGFEFYRNHFFSIDGAPKYFHDRTYPVDIHSAAQSIITLLALKCFDSEGQNMCLSVLEWTIRHMWDNNGYFYYQIHPLITNKISYARWSQAWMLEALTTFLEAYPEGRIKTVTHAN